jgi:hypothetical protein
MRIERVQIVGDQKDGEAERVRSWRMS